MAGCIVCGVAERTGGRDVARLAVLMAERQALRLVLVHVLAPPAARRAAALPHAYARLAADVREGGRMLARIADELGSAVAVEARLEIGAAAARLVAVAEAEEAELLVLGRREQGVFEPTLLGSVAAEVVSGAPCPVMIVRPSTADQALAVLGRAQLEIDRA
jgi:nucleotide-binding universal stress UspA family protein